MVTPLQNENENPAEAEPHVSENIEIQKRAVNNEVFVWSVKEQDENEDEEDGEIDDVSSNSKHHMRD